VTVGYERLVRSNLSEVEVLELATVDSLAQSLRGYLETSAPDIDLVHVHGGQSADVQLIAARLLRTELGFAEEQRFGDEVGLTTRARPDFIYRLGAGRGILAEVERGGTTTNNHDLKDFWKTHIAPDAQHLFLVVPHANWSAGGKPRERPFIRVSQRLAAFFGDERREVDVVSAHIFGYGNITLDSLPPA
jgi:hypothetical protein